MMVTIETIVMAAKAIQQRQWRATSASLRLEFSISLALHLMVDLRGWYPIEVLRGCFADEDKGDYRLHNLIGAIAACCQSSKINNADTS
mmetsp:Transcript_39084/g.80043  ORF Transcript_39084/g.80043 Transcript_39084/m.80043 type:complete len:89 (+) Transcript_39084:364-630(+)